jgi:hypothetical protein
MFVDETTKQEIWKRLDAAAEKLGVAAEYMWGVLVKQGYALAVADAVTAVLLLLVLLGLLHGMKNAWAYDYDGEEEGREMLMAVSGAFCAIGFCVLVVVFFGYARDAILYWYNPEFYALKFVLETLK